MDKSENYLEEIENISDAYEDVLLAMTDDEIEQEVLSEEGNPHQVAENVLEFMNSSIKRLRKNRLSKARQLYEDKSKKQTTEFSLNLTRKQKEDLLLNIIANNPQVGNALTIQHREFHNMSEQDLDDLLADLDALNLLKKSDDKP